jgi:hypothetical protein
MGVEVISMRSGKKIMEGGKEVVCMGCYHVIGVRRAKTVEGGKP